MIEKRELTLIYKSLWVLSMDNNFFLYHLVWHELFDFCVWARRPQSVSTR